MPFHPVYILSLAPLVVPAQIPWSAFLAGLRENAHPRGPWVLVVTAPAGSEVREAGWTQTDLDLRLEASGEFVVQPAPSTILPPPGWKAGEPHWALLTPEGRVALEGVGRPTPSAALEALRGCGFVPSWERRAEFLKANPGHGEARWAGVEEALRLAERRIQRLQAQGILKGPSEGLGFLDQPPLSFATPPDPDGGLLAEGVLRELCDELEGLLQLPVGPDGSALLSLSLRCARWEVAQSPRLRSLLVRVWELVREGVAAHPLREAAWMPLAHLGPALGRSPLEVAVSLRPYPGALWPSPSFLRSTVQALSGRRQWAEALALLDGLPLPEPPPDPSRWLDYRTLRAEVQFLRLQPLIHLGRGLEAEASLREARRWAGRAWPSWASRARRALAPVGSSLKERLQALIEGPGEVDPAPPPAVPIPRLVLLGEAPWAAQWEGLRQSLALAEWGTDEVRWESTSIARAGWLASHYGWPPGPRWMLQLGEAIAATGDTCPTPQSLATLLAAVAPGRLHRLHEALRLSPGNLDLRQERAEACLKLRPRGEREAQAAEDARLSRMPLHFPEGWKPSEDVWPWHAQKLLPEVELELDSWPSRPGLWSTWIQWSALHPARPSPLALARRLEAGGSGRRFVAALPGEVHQAVAEGLRQGGRFEEMRAWFQEAWEELAHQPGGASPNVTFFEGSPEARLKELEATILAPLREALRVLRRDREYLELEGDLRTLKARWSSESQGKLPDPK